MKKFAYAVPVILVLIFTLISNRLFASGSVSPITLVLISFAVFVVVALTRPKNAGPSPSSDIEKKVRGEFAKDAFADDDKRSAKFQAALKDYSGNMPKAALNKLEKLAPQCQTDQETYAVAMAEALVFTALNKTKDAAREYNRALSLHLSSDVAIALGSCQQRLGDLDKAVDSYEFALELEPGSIDARSRLATAYVADGSYQTGLDQALLVLEQEETNSSALATAAICYGLLDDPVMHRHYMDLAVKNGYKKDKITQTVDALKKRK